MSNMYSKESIAAAARRQGRSEEEIERMLVHVGTLKLHGLVKTSNRGDSVGLTREGRRRVAELRATGQLPPR